MRNPPFGNSLTETRGEKMSRNMQDESADSVIPFPVLV